MRNLLLCVAVVLALGCVPERRPCPNRCPCRSVVAFTASYCAPCQRDKPKIAILRRAGVRVDVVDVQVRPDLAAKYGVQSIPFYVILDGAAVVHRTGRLNEATLLLVR